MVRETSGGWMAMLGGKGNRNSIAVLALREEFSGARKFWEISHSRLGESRAGGRSLNFLYKTLSSVVGRKDKQERYESENTSSCPP